MSIFRSKGLFVLVFCCLALLFGTATQANAAATPVTVKNSTGGTMGIFDPSLAPDDSRKLVWMSYTAVDPSVKWPSQNNMVESIRLASSADGGATWTDVGQPVSAFDDVTVSGDSAGTAGTWVNEVSQLIYDPGATPAERYKIIWHHYLVVNGQSQFQNSWLAMKMADLPEHLPAASEKKVFSGFAYNSNANWTMGNLRSPAAGIPVVSLDRISPALNTCVFTEPGMLATATTLYLSVSCTHMSDGDKLVVLLKCGAPCHPADVTSPWTYVATLFNKASSPRGYDNGMDASSLFQGTDGGYYITVTPAKNAGEPWPGFYQGCMIYKFTDLAHGVLAKTPMANVSGVSGSFNGACAFNTAEKKGGMLYDQLEQGNPAPFHIFASGVGF